jgi:hypothetical protein
MRSDQTPRPFRPDEELVHRNQWVIDFGGHLYGPFETADAAVRYSRELQWSGITVREMISP